MESVEGIREQFPITKNKVYLAHASRGPLPKSAADAVCKYVHGSMDSAMTKVDDGVPHEGGKPFFAKLIGAKPGEIAFVENTSVGLNIAANVLHYPPGSNVVTADNEYSSVIYPYLRKGLGVKVRYVENVDGRILLEDMEKAVDDKTVAVVVSHVHWLNGFRHDLRALSEIAHEHGAYLIVDAIQSAGAMRIDVKRDGVDFLASACYKWLLSPPGAGYLYVRDELIEGFEPPLVGWRTNTNVEERDHRSLRLPETASRFEIGTPSFASLVGATESLKLLLNAGTGRIERRILRLTGHLMESLKNLGLRIQTPEESSQRSGIVNFRIDNPREVVERLNNKGIVPCGTSAAWARCSPQFYSTIRVAPHFYNTEEEIETFVDELRVQG